PRGRAPSSPRAALDPDADRSLTKAAIKKGLSRPAGAARAGLHKVRPWSRHQDHLHIRLRCPAGNADCKPQPAPPSEEGCGKDLDFWFTDAVLHPKPSPPGRQLTMANLPAECRKVLNAP